MRAVGVRVVLGRGGDFFRLVIAGSRSSDGTGGMAEQGGGGGEGMREWAVLLTSVKGKEGRARGRGGE